MSLSHEHTDNFFIGQSSILDANLRLLFRAFHYETPCTYQHLTQNGQLALDKYMEMALFLFYFIVETDRGSSRKK